MTVRLIRIMEYTYESHEAAEADMVNWAVGPIGSRSFRHDRLIRSSVILPSSVFIDADDYQPDPELRDHFTQPTASSMPTDDGEALG